MRSLLSLVFLFVIAACGSRVTEPENTGTITEPGLQIASTPDAGDAD